MKGELQTKKYSDEKRTTQLSAIRVRLAVCRARCHWCASTYRSYHAILDYRVDFILKKLAKVSSDVAEQYLVWPNVKTVGRN